MTSIYNQSTRYCTVQGEHKT